MEMNHVLVVEDDKEIREGVEIYLKSQGYEVFQAADGAEGLDVIEREDIHLAIVDIMMPVMDGISMVVKLREKYDFPVIFLSAKSEEVDKIMGLNMGADDYVTKPFSIHILLKKIAVILKRETENPRNIYEDGYLRIDFDRVKVEIEGKECMVTPTEFRMLRLFIEHAGQLLSHNVLLEQLWDCDEAYVDRHTLAVNVNRLRGKIEDAEHKYISNVYGMGYQWLR